MKLSDVIATRTNKTIYRDGKKAIKVFGEDYKTSDVLRESLSTALVFESGFNTPSLLETVKLDNTWAIVTEYIEGKTLQTLIEENPDKYPEYLELFVDIQIDMHSHSGLGLPDMREKLNRKIRQSGLDATARYDLHTRLESTERHTKLCHGDYNPSNIVITPDNKYYVLDWAHAMCGNASADVAKSYLMFCISGHEKEAEDYLKLFCKKTDTARQYVDIWLSILAASRLGKNKPEEREFLMRWANVMDFQ